MDECASVAGLDPIEFRLQHIEEPRLKRVLEEAVASAPPVLTPAKGLLHGRGVACGIYKKTSFAAVVADVLVDPASGEVRVVHMHCAHDCGKVINPDQVRAQCEGNLVWGLGMVLVESWSVEARNFGESPIPRMTQLPRLSVHLVDHGEPPSGAGETAIVAAGAAIANAVRAATGWRLRQLPLEPRRLQRHLKETS
jgi:isoquinoline 1-oxidoreductase beta subunit